MHVEVFIPVLGELYFYVKNHLPQVYCLWYWL